MAAKEKRKSEKFGSEASGDAGDNNGEEGFFTWVPKFRWRLPKDAEIEDLIAVFQSRDPYIFGSI